jgi:hypothetical protein
MASTARHDRRLWQERLGFRINETTKASIERAAQFEPRKLTAVCMTALTPDHQINPLQCGSHRTFRRYPMNGQELP